MDSENLPYTIQFSETALQSLRRFPHHDQRRIVERIEKLAQDPRTMANVKRLVNFDVAYRLRIGDYRVLFDRDDVIRIIDIIEILPRARAYRRK